jgi:hypothetical protein
MPDAPGPKQRALHNHVFQVKPRRIGYVEPPCPACESIDMDVMTWEYAAYSHAALSWERDFERRLRE